MSAAETPSVRSSPHRRLLSAESSIMMSLAAMTVYLVSTVPNGGYEHWLAKHQGQLLVWRICVYVALAAGWCWIRQRLIQQEKGPEPWQCIRRTELGAVVAVVLLEAIALLQGK